MLIDNPVQRFFDQLLEQKKSSKAANALLDSRPLKEINSIVDGNKYLRNYVDLVQPGHRLLNNMSSLVPINNMLGI